MSKTLGTGAYGDPEKPAQSRDEFEAATADQAAAEPEKTPAARKTVDSTDGEAGQ